MRRPTPQQHRALAVALALSLMALLGACRKEPKHPPPAPPPAMPARSAALPLQAILPRDVTAAAWLDLAAVRRDPRLQRVWQEVGMPGGASREGDRERLMSQASELVVAWYGMDGSRPLRLLRGAFVPALEALGPESWDIVEPATFPRATLHFRNNDLLRQLGLTTLRWPMPTPSRPTAAL
jgi:hypothetical protein